MEHRCLSPWKGAVAGGLIVFVWTSVFWTIVGLLAGEPGPGFRVADLPPRMAAAFFWTWILGKIPGLTLKDAALYGLFFGLSVGILGALPHRVWWNSSAPFALLSVADAAIAWTLASLALSRCYAAACALPGR